MTKTAAGKKSSKQLEREISSRLAVTPPRLKLLGHVTGLPVYLVSGEQVRNKTDIDFTAGGHDLCYPGYIKKPEVWIDDAIHVFDRVATIFHEIIERNLMVNRGMDYDDAHDIACKREIELRKEMAKNPPKFTDLKIVERALKPFANEAVPSGKRRGKASRTNTFGGQ